MGTLALIEVLARDGSVRQSLKVSRWPLRVGRALDNDLVLDDAHTAAHHFSVDANEDGVFVAVGDSVNGLQVGGQRLASGERWQAAAEPMQLLAGRTQLRLRLSEHALPAEVPVAATRALIHGAGSLALLLGLAAAVFGFETYLSVDPDGFTLALVMLAIRGLGLALGWCGFWAVLSKIFNHRGHFWWHVRVLLIALLAWSAIDTGGALLAFSLSWSWASDFDFVPKLCVMAAALYFHLQAVEPHRMLMTRAMATSALLVGIGLSLWNNWQESDRFGEELYMNHLFPPALRLTRPVDTDAFMQRLAPLQKSLDDSAGRETDSED